jgi:hypothetical protein
MKYVSILFFLLLIAFKSQAQDPRWTNLPKYDDKFLHYGFTIGVNMSGFKDQVSKAYFKDTLKGAHSVYSPGFSLGFIVNARLHEHFDLRFLPTVGFYTRSIVYDFNNNYPTVNQSIQSTFIELPLLLKYKSQRRKNSRMYMIGGVKPSIEAGAKKNELLPSNLRTTGFDLCIDYGFGFDLYFALFKFSPEIRFSQGMLNLLNNDPNIYSSSLSKLTSHTISLYLNFE